MYFQQKKHKIVNTSIRKNGNGQVFWCHAVPSNRYSNLPSQRVYPPRFHPSTWHSCVQHPQPLEQQEHLVGPGSPKAQVRPFFRRDRFGGKIYPISGCFFGWPPVEIWSLAFDVFLDMPEICRRTKTWKEKSLLRLERKFLTKKKTELWYFPPSIDFLTNNGPFPHPTSRWAKELTGASRPFGAVHCHGFPHHRCPIDHGSYHPNTSPSVTHKTKWTTIGFVEYWNGLNNWIEHSETKWVLLSFSNFWKLTTRTTNFYFFQKRHKKNPGYLVLKPPKMSPVVRTYTPED